MIAMMLTIGVAIAVSLLSPVATVFNPDPTSFGPVAYKGWGVRGTISQRRVSPMNPLTGEPFVQRLLFDQKVSCGWPLPALGFRVVDLEQSPRIPTRLFSTCLDPRDLAYDTWLIGGIPAHQQRSSSIFYIGHIPLTPRPLGFTINTLLAAIPLYLLLGGWTDLRAAFRLRKGRCPRCGYDARGLAACPECGLESPPAPSRAQHIDICHLPFAICNLSPRQGSQ
ncbi:MAG: hypothetical protein IT436_11925 [Phycisphaerales bacterium]|nr:hypothetical protein [Phycisphaerales bacterium]